MSNGSIRFTPRMTIDGGYWTDDFVWHHGPWQ